MGTIGSRIGCEWLEILALGAIVNTIQIYLYIYIHLCEVLVR